MGLESGDFGAKKTILNMLRLLHDSGAVVDGTRTVRKLDELHAHYKVKQANVAIVVDGNVMVRSAPKLSYKDFCHFIRRQVLDYFSVAKHVIVVFDEPENVSIAKREEQAQRDAQRKKREIVTSEEILSLQKNDAYNECDISNCRNIHEIVENRSTRARLMDMVFDAVMTKERSARARWVGSSLSSSSYQQGETTLTFDGLDPRGDARRHDAIRLPGIQSTSLKIETILRRDKAVGEGDLKLVVVEQAIERSTREEGSPFANTKIVLHSTIDTDSLLINLISEAERVSRGETNNLTSLLCLREPGRKRRHDDDEFVPCHYQIVDMSRLYSAVMLLCFGEDTHSVRELGREAVALVTMAVVCAGCDFIGKNQIKGVRANELMCSVASVIKENPCVLPRMRGAWSGSVSDSIKMCKVLKCVLDKNGRDLGVGQHNVPVVLSSENYNGSVSAVRKKYALDVQNAREEGLLRAAWVVSYWHGFEFDEVVRFGFC